MPTFLQFDSTAAMTPPAGATRLVVGFASTGGQGENSRSPVWGGSSLTYTPGTWTISGGTRNTEIYSLANPSLAAGTLTWNGGGFMVAWWMRGASLVSVFYTGVDTSVVSTTDEIECDVSSTGNDLVLYVFQVSAAPSSWTGGVTSDSLGVSSWGHEAGVAPTQSGGLFRAAEFSGCGSAVSVKSMSPLGVKGII